jgi:hypothetical protein
MKITMMVIGLAIAAAGAAPAVAQQSLGDVAGSIKLKRPQGESVVIDQSSVGRMRRSPGGETERGHFSNVIDDCLTETRALHDLLVEARDGEAFYRQEWRERVEETGFRLDSARADVALSAGEAIDARASEYAERGANAVGDALQILNGAIAQNRPVFSEARELSEEAIRLFGEAGRALAVEARREAARSTPPMINPIEADRAINELCRNRYGTGSSGFSSCVSEQKAALDTINGRSAPAVGLDLTSFNLVRNNCRTEWSNDFVAQDRCERRRIAAQRSP